MAWNMANPVPWKRLIREWAVFSTICILGMLAFTDNRRVETYIAIVIGGSFYVVTYAVMAKFGFVRKSWKDLRADAAARPPRQIGRTATPSTRQRPAPTSRTGGGGQRPANKRKR